MICTKYVLKNRDSGTYYVADYPPVSLNVRHLVSTTNDLELAKRFDGHSIADATALTLPWHREWVTVPISVKEPDAVRGVRESAEPAGAASPLPTPAVSSPLSEHHTEKAA